MALLGLSLVLASVVWIAFRRPPFIQTLVALWRGEPRIRRSPPDDTRSTTGTRSTDGREVRPPSDSKPDSAATPAAARGTGSPPPTEQQAGPASDLEPNPSASAAVPSVVIPSPQTTPKASAMPFPPPSSSSSSSSSPPAGPVPTLALSPEPPASAADAPRASPASTGSMPPPPPPPPSRRRPPVPDSGATNNSSARSSSSSLLPPPSAASRARQPGSSTLAPPPSPSSAARNSSSSNPNKSSSSSRNKVTLAPGRSPLDWARLSSDPAANLRGGEFAPGDPYVRVTPSALRARHGRRGAPAWTALGGRVYNLTPYLGFHPGGAPELLRAAGRDGTRLFADVHPWVNYDAMLAACLVGLLVAEGEGEGDPQASEMDAMD
ncbi:hypothetical protein GGR56DRAFT_695979 [Xylariaceae sp. FL0804]|nr:hypothetical protein GGR56DRAFT_695979 [Xylariaceae sp. FL0804]